MYAFVRSCVSVLLMSEESSVAPAFLYLIQFLLFDVAKYNYYKKYVMGIWIEMM